MSDEKKDEIKQRGIKAMRKRQGDKPTYDCKNCGCKRYSPCGCIKKAGKNAVVTT